MRIQIEVEPDFILRHNLPELEKSVRLVFEDELARFINGAWALKQRVEERAMADRDVRRERT